MLIFSARLSHAKSRRLPAAPHRVSGRSLCDLSPQPIERSWGIFQGIKNKQANKNVRGRTPSLRTDFLHNVARSNFPDCRGSVSPFVGGTEGRITSSSHWSWSSQGPPWEKRRLAQRDTQRPHLPKQRRGTTCGLALAEECVPCVIRLKSPGENLTPGAWQGRGRDVAGA